MKRIPVNLLLILLLLLQGCLKEDRSMCKSWLLLRFRYTLNDQYTNLFGQEVHKITVYVFDNHGKYVDRFSEQGNHLTNDYVMRLPLPEGVYSVVAYGGDFTTYRVGELNPQNNLFNSTLRQGITDLSDFRTELQYTGAAENDLYPVVTPDDLYAGFADGAVAELNSGHITDVDLIKNTKQIIVRIYTPPVTLATDAAVSPFDVYITAQNGRYLSDNNTDLRHIMCKYTPVNTVIQSGYIESDLKIMRLMLGQSARLVIRSSSTQEIIYNKNMIEQIAQNPKYATQEDFDREDRFIFEITLPSGNQGTEAGVTINGWKINQVFPDLE